MTSLTGGLPRQEAVEWDCILDAKAAGAEMPVWVEDDNALYWADLLGRSVNRLDIFSSINRRWEMPEMVGTFALCPDRSKALIALRTGLFKLDLGTSKLSPLVDAPYDTENYHFNDGRCDADGRFWVGTMRSSGSSLPNGGAAWYRFDGNGLSRQIDGTTIANGLAWSPDGRTMYVADRPNWQILAFDYDTDKSIPSGRRIFARVPEGQIPDGAAIDRDGGYWIALFGAGRIVKFSPDGQLERDLKAPTMHPTNIAFGGNGHSTMFVTTARILADVEAEPLAGGLFCADVKACGFPEPFCQVI